MSEFFHIFMEYFKIRFSWEHLERSARLELMD